MVMEMPAASASRGRRPRFSTGQLMALIGALASVSALYFEMTKQAAAVLPFNGRPVVEPLVLAVSIVVAAIAVASLRRSSFTGTLLALSLSASAMALYGGLQQSRFTILGLPAFALLTVAIPLWIRRELGADPSARVGWSRRLVLAGRVGLDSSLNLLGLVVLLMVYEAVGGVLSPAPAGFPTGGGPVVYASPSTVVRTGAIGTPLPSLAPIPIGPGQLPEFAPPPPEISFEVERYSTITEFPTVETWENDENPPNR